MSGFSVFGFLHMGPAVFEGETEIEIGFIGFVLGRNSFAFEGETKIEIGFIGFVLGRNSYWARNSYGV